MFGPNPSRPLLAARSPLNAYNQFRTYLDPSYASKSQEDYNSQMTYNQFYFGTPCRYAKIINLCKKISAEYRFL